MAFDAYTILQAVIAATLVGTARVLFNTVVELGRVTARMDEQGRRLDRLEEAEVAARLAVVRLAAETSAKRAL